MARNRKKRNNGLLVAFFCLPLAVILCFLIYYTSLDSVDRVTLDAPMTDEVFFKTEEEVTFFVDMCKNALPIKTAMRDVSKEIPVLITLYSGDSPSEYRFYPSLNLSGCLLVDPEGKNFVLDTETAKDFLLRPEFDYLYADYFLPELSVISGENKYKVDPVECEWKYFKTDGNEYTYEPSKLATGEETYIILKGLDNKLDFSPDGEVRPYEMTDISYVADNGSEYAISDISELDLSFDTLLNVSFSVKWSELNGAQASGKAKYSFKILYDIPAIVELPKKEFSLGEVIVVDATHLNNDETIGLKTSMNIPQIGFGITENSKGVALLPIGLENGVGVHSLEITTGVGSIKEDIVLTDRKNAPWTPIEITEEQYYSMLSTEKMDEFKAALSGATEARPQTDYFNYAESGLHLPVNKSNTPVFTYGQPVNLGSANTTGDTGERVCEGLVYELEAGTSVRSAQAGEVVFSGTLAPTGNTVVVYHGYGIYTYYFHLESLNVRVGYTLTDGEIIGSAGQSGFTNGKTVLHYAVSIDGVFVDPMWFHK
ncbi:MAG: M23 family metallopeptidase [Clostridia bacterium]|nr:M23 family metallopeptidase [Clostridia bacterium]